MTRALLLTGAPGTGKSSVLEALSTLLEVEGVEYGALESEQLAWGSPWLAPAEWLPQLAAVLELQQRAGRRLFCVVATTETGAELRAVLDAVGAERTLVVCLTAPPEVAAARVAAREPDAWPGKAALVSHAAELAATMPAIAGVDAVVATDGRDPADAARDVLEAMRAAGLLASPR